MAAVTEVEATIARDCAIKGKSYKKDDKAKFPANVVTALIEQGKVVNQSAKPEGK